jgi:hypothetical protein
MVTVKNSSSSRRRGVSEKEISRRDLTRKVIPTPIAVTGMGSLAEKQGCQRIGTPCGGSAHGHFR